MGPFGAVGVQCSKDRRRYDWLRRGGVISNCFVWFGFVSLGYFEFQITDRFIKSCLCGALDLVTWIRFSCGLFFFLCCRRRHALVIAHQPRLQPSASPPQLSHCFLIIVIMLSDRSFSFIPVALHIPSFHDLLQDTRSPHPPPLSPAFFNFVVDHCWHKFYVSQRPITLSLPSYLPSPWYDISVVLLFYILLS